MHRRFLFLAAGLQPFLISGIRSLLSRPGTEALLLYDRDVAHAPVQPEAHEHLRVFSFAASPDPLFWDHITAFKPDVVFCSGWMYTRYLGWCSGLKKQGARTICAMDTPWKGSWKQQLWRLAGQVLLKRCFTDAWVPGHRQQDYAGKLGFRQEHIHQSLYAPDTALFRKARLAFLDRNYTTFPKTFLYTGRLVPHKLAPLLAAFCSLSDSERQDWELLVAGTGPMEKHPMLTHKAVRILPFCSQPELAEIMSAGGIHCLCSSNEPWGTVIQEAASAGMPLISSIQCGAQPYFLEDQVNGFLCDGTDTDSIRKAILQAVASSDDRLFAMAAASHEKGMISGSGTWAAVLHDIAAK